MSARRAALAAVCAAGWTALTIVQPARAAEPGAAPPAARPRSVLARVERAEVRLGAPFAYEIELVHAPGETVALAPELDAPPFRGTGGTCRPEPAASGGDVRTVCAIRLSLFELGPHDVPLLRLAIRSPRGEETLPVEGPRVTGVGMVDPAAAPDALALRPPAPPVPLLVPTWAPALWALGAAAVVALALLARRAWRTRARAAAEPPAPEPPDERLARRLDGLAARGLSAREHFFELSAIVREWVGGATGLPAPEMTTAELADRLAADPNPRVNGAALVAFLETADLVKFAGDDASPERCAAAIAWARRLPATAAAAAQAAADRAPPVAGDGGRA